MASNYAIGAHFERFIQQQIESGRYRSESEVVRDAFRLPAFFRFLAVGPAASGLRW